MNTKALYTLFVICLTIFCSYGQNIWGSRNIGIGEVSVIEIAQNGDIWMGANGGGLAYYSNDSAKWSYYTTANTAQLPSDTITAILPVEIDGVMHAFVGTPSGVYDFNSNGNNLLSALPETDVKGIVYRPDSLWILTKNFFVRYDSSSAHQTDYTPTIGNITCVQRTSACPGFWAGTANSGCFKTVDGVSFLYLDTNVGNQKLVDNRINAVAMDGQCNIKMVGTKGGFSICPGTMPCQNFTTANGLPQNDIATINGDCTGRVWLGTRDSGLVIFTPPSTFQRVTMENGLPDNQITYISFLNSGPGQCKAYVGSKDGNISVLDTAGIIEQVLSAVPAIQSSNVAVKVFPQPASSKVNFAVENEIPFGQIVLTDVAGRVVKTKGITKGYTSEITTEDLAPGTYIYGIYSGPKVVGSGKVVINR